MRSGVLVASALGLAGLASAFGSAFGGGTPAQATSCLGPTIEHTTGDLDRGATLRVEGRLWGEVDGYEDCDPDEPLGDITIVVVQGGVEHPLATVDADDDFRFVLEVPLPAGLQPGLADVRAGNSMYAQSYDASPERLVVSDAPPVAPSATSAPSTAAPTTTAARVDAAAPTTTAAPVDVAVGGGDDRHPLGVAVAVGVVGALLVATAVLFARQRERS